MVAEARIADKVVSVDRRRGRSEGILVHRHHDEAAGRERRRVGHAEAFEHLHVGFWPVEVGLDEGAGLLGGGKDTC